MPKLEVGQTCTMQDGRKAMILEPRVFKWTSSNPEDYGAPREMLYFNGIILENGEPCSWSADGKYSPVSDHPLEIVSIDGTGN